jgi:hypothetical protein
MYRFPGVFGGPTITGPTLPLAPGREGAPYPTVQFTATPEGARWSVSGSVPPGMSFDPNGTYRGTPTEAGVYVFEVTATDVLGSATRAVEHTIRAQEVEARRPKKDPSRRKGACGGGVAAQDGAWWLMALVWAVLLPFCARTCGLHLRRL